MEKIRIENVNKFYGGTVHAVKNLTLHCQDQEFWAILGPSGCGKSSTLRMLVGLEEVTSGKIYFNEKDVTDFHPSKRNISLAFENYALYPHLSVYENIVYPLRAKGYSEEQIKQHKRLEELLNLFNLRETDILNAYPKSLSGGQAQLVSLVRCLVKDVDIYLLDEPLSHLDEEMRVRMRTLIKVMHHKMKKTFIYVTHDQLEAFALADKIAIMNFGVLQQVGSPEEIYNHPANQFVASFIGEPPMNFLPVRLHKDHGDVFLHGKSYKTPLSGRFEDKVRIGQDYILGMRSEQISVSKEQSDTHPIAAEVLVFENLGEINQVTMELDETVMIKETTHDFRIEMGQKIYMRFDTDTLHLFDSKTLEAIH